MASYRAIQYENTKVEAISDAERHECVTGSPFCLESILGIDQTSYEFFNPQLNNDLSEALMSELGFSWFNTIQCKSYNTKWEIVAFGQSYNLRVILDTYDVNHVSFKGIADETVRLEVYEALFNYHYSVHFEKISNEHAHEVHENMIIGASIDAVIHYLLEQAIT